MYSLGSAVRICAALVGALLLIAGCVAEVPPKGGQRGPQAPPAPSPGPSATPKPQTQKRMHVPAVYAGRYGCKNAYGRRALFDPTKPKGGGCWVCPKSNPQRTAFPVSGKRACQPRGTITSAGGVPAKYLGGRCKKRGFKQPSANRCYYCPRSYQPHNIRVKIDLRRVADACRLQRR